MAVQWNNGGDRSTVDIQVGGPGNQWKTFAKDGSLDAPSGGGRARTTLWGRGEKGGLQPRSIVYTGNPDDWTANLSYPLINEEALKRLLCPFTVRARQYCSPNRTNMTSYVAPGMRGYVDTTVTSFGYDNGLAMSDGQGTDVMRTAAIDGSIEEVWVTVAHDDISLTTSDVDYNKVIGISAETCAGACGAVGTTEEDSFLAVTDMDASPSYAGGSAPWLYWTTDSWATRTGVRIGVDVGSNALDVVLAGSRVIVFSDTKPPVYAQLTDIYNGVVDPLLWATSSGFSTISGSNYPRAAVAVDSSTILCVGTTGQIWLSTDGGISFTAIYAANSITTQTLNAIDAQPDGNAYAVGNAGAFVRLTKTPGQNAFTASLMVVRDAALNILSSNLNSVRTPPTRGDEVYIGSAGGEIWRSRNVNETKPLWFNMGFDRKGIGSIVDMSFAGYKGNVLFIIQAAVDSTSRVLRDFSGGNLGNDVEIIGDFVTPGNAKYNSIAAVNVNFAITAGNVHDTYGFLGKIRPS